MKTFIVPIDFTEASINTAIQAGRVAAQVKNSRMILYYVHDKISAGSDGSPLAEGAGDRRKVTRRAFENVKADMLSAEPSLQIEYREEEGSGLVSSLEKFAAEQQAAYIVIGVGESTGLEQFLSGSNAVDIAKRNVCPVIMLPPHAQFKGVRNVLLASDYQSVDTTTPLATIRSVLSDFESRVQVVHVGSDAQKAEELHDQTVRLREMLIEYHPEFHVIYETDFMAAINRLVGELSIDLIMTVPHAHGFFSNLFSTGRTKMLAHQSSVPVIAIHA